MAFLYLSLVAITAATFILLLAALFAGSVIGGYVGAAIDGIPWWRHSWGLGAHRADAWGKLLGALAALGAAMLGLAEACLSLLP